MRTAFLRWLIFTCCSTSIAAQTPARFRDSVSRETQLQKIEQLDDQPEMDLGRFFGVVDRMLALQDIQAKSSGTAQLADMLWKYDNTQGRQLFERTLKLLEHKPESTNDALLRRLHLKVVQLIAKHDTLWAKRLIDAKSRDDQNSDLGNRSEQNIAVAASLIADEPETAIDFAR